MKQSTKKKNLNTNFASSSPMAPSDTSPASAAPSSTTPAISPPSSALPWTSPSASAPRKNSASRKPISKNSSNSHPKPSSFAISTIASCALIANSPISTASLPKKLSAAASGTLSSPKTNGKPLKNFAKPSSAANVSTPNSLTNAKTALASEFPSLLPPFRSMEIPP